ncbi:lipase family protein [Nocardia sp. NPDC046473]|uniref:lipase family protein n=1 Tax=Nocardia sp. NPDC046473 TaxID=3155733 RepID=UPI0033E45BED
MRRTLIALGAVVLLAGPLDAVGSADPPANTPGTVVGTDALSRDLWIEGTGAARRLTYWTQTSDHQPALSTGAIFMPAGTPPPGGWPVVSWEHGTTGLSDDCAPTIIGRIDIEMTYLATWMKQGYAVVATDYIGVGTPRLQPFLDGRAEAYAAIDMVRAARAVDDSLSAKWVAIGASEGGGAAVFTSALATSYAPDLDFRGAVATGPASQIAEMPMLLTQPAAPDLHNWHLTAYGAYIVGGLKAARPALDLDSYLSPVGKDLVEAAKTLCFDALVDRAHGVEVKQMITRPVSEGNFPAIAHEVFDIPMTGYDRPLFIGQGLQDQDVFPEMTAKLIADLEAHGVHPEAHLYPDKDHLATVLGSLPESVPFVARLFA